MSTPAVDLREAHERDAVTLPTLDLRLAYPARVCWDAHVGVLGAVRLYEDPTLRARAAALDLQLA